MRDLLFTVAMTFVGLGFAAGGVLIGWWLRGVHDPPAAATIHRLPTRPRSIPEPRRVRRHIALYDHEENHG